MIVKIRLALAYIRCRDIGENRRAVAGNIKVIDCAFYIQVGTAWFVDGRDTVVAIRFAEAQLPVTASSCQCDISYILIFL